jgi:hypothetical protein
MLIVETIRKIRLWIHRDGKSIRKTAKELRVSRNTVRKVVRSEQTAFTYRRSSQPRPVLGAFVEGFRTLPQLGATAARRGRQDAGMAYR